MDVRGLISALEERVDELAGRAFEIYGLIVPDARSWSGAQRAAFVEQARERLVAVLAVAKYGSEVDESIRRDLQSMSVSAVGSSLTSLLGVVRISRDVLMQAAMRMTDESAQGKAVVLEFSQRMLPAVDRITDAITSGYWSGRLELTKAVDLTPLIRHIYELRRSIDILEAAGNFIHTNSEFMTIDQVGEAGESVARQAQRLMVIVNELDADRHAIQP